MLFTSLLLIALITGCTQDIGSYRFSIEKVQDTNITMPSEDNEQLIDEPLVDETIKYTGVVAEIDRCRADSISTGIVFQQKDGTFMYVYSPDKLFTRTKQYTVEGHTVNGTKFVSGGTRPCTILVDET